MKLVPNPRAAARNRLGATLKPPCRKCLNSLNRTENLVKLAPMKLVVLLIWVVIATLNARAESNSDSVSLLRGLSASFATAYVDYREPGLMSEIGLLEGARLTFFNDTPDSSLVYFVEGEFLMGHLTYNGSDLVTGTGLQNRTADSLLNLRATIGTMRELASSAFVTPFAGLAYRLLSDKIEGSGGYLRQISYLYLPVGTNLCFWLGSWSLVASADFDLVLAGLVRNQLSDLNSANSDLQMKNSGLGYRAMVSLRRDFRSYSLHFEPYYQRWTMNESERIAVIFNNQPGYFYEPQNTSDLIGLNLGANF